MAQQQRRAVDTGRYRRRFRLWMLLLAWLLVMTAVGGWALLSAEERKHKERFEERLTICREDEVIKRIIRDDLDEQIAQEEALLSDPSVLPPFLDDATRLSLARHRRQRALLEPRDCVAYAHGVRPTDGG